MLQIKQVRTPRDISGVAMISGPLHIIEDNTMIIRHTFKETSRIMLLDTAMLALTLAITATVIRWPLFLARLMRHQITFQMQA